jgi:hypothetical protein
VPDYVRPIGSTRLKDGDWEPFLIPTCERSTSTTPLFWHVDIGCLSEQHIDGEDLKSTYHWPQIFKVWIDVVQDHARGLESLQQIEPLISRWADMSAAT